MGAPEHIRDRLALVLDYSTLADAEAVAVRLAPWFGVAKVGLELFSAAGPDAVAAMADHGFRVFADLKLHDIPNTVGQAARVLGRHGASMVTLHTSGGVPMLRAGVKGLLEGAAEAGLPAPIPLGVTVLTSDPEASAKLLGERVGRAVEAGCGGVVCAAADLPAVSAVAPGLLTVVPGIRFAGGDTHDQSRVSTPAAAIAAGAGLLVIGRAVTGAPDPEAAAERIVSEVGSALR